jgi:hypothetical protein
MTRIATPSIRTPALVDEQFSATAADLNGLAAQGQW